MQDRQWTCAGHGCGKENDQKANSKFEIPLSELSELMHLVCEYGINQILGQGPMSQPESSTNGKLPLHLPMHKVISSV